MMSFTMPSPGAADIVYHTPMLLCVPLTASALEVLSRVIGAEHGTAGVGDMIAHCMVSKIWKSCVQGLHHTNVVRVTLLMLCCYVTLLVYSIYH